MTGDVLLDLHIDAERLETLSRDMRDTRDRRDALIRRAREQGFSEKQIAKTARVSLTTLRWVLSQRKAA